MNSLNVIETNEVEVEETRQMFLGLSYLPSTERVAFWIIYWGVLYLKVKIHPLKLARRFCHKFSGPCHMFLWRQLLPSFYWLWSMRSWMHTTNGTENHLFTQVRTKLVLSTLLAYFSQFAVRKQISMFARQVFTIKSKIHFRHEFHCFILGSLRCMEYRTIQLHFR